MKNYVKNWLTSTKIYLLVCAAAKHMGKLFPSLAPPINQVYPTAKEQAISVIELQGVGNETNTH